MTDYRLRSAAFRDLDAGTIAGWESLEERALESNAYLSPHFVIPAIRYLSRSKELGETMIVYIEKVGTGTTKMVGAGVFIRSSGTWKFPIPHLLAYRSPHSYLSGVLLDQDDAEGAIRAFFRFFCEKAAPWHGVRFTWRLAEGPQAALIARVAEEIGVPWYENATFPRAILVPSEGGEVYIKARFSSHRHKTLSQRMRRLENKGEVSWRCLFGADVTSKTIDRFLEIEHSGWKGSEGTSLTSRSSHEMFFREIVDGFRKRERIFFTELLLDGVAIASTSNLISGGAGFAFKIGWHADYSKESPGVLNEVEYIRRAPVLCGNLAYIDSGADGGSFIDALWTGRRIITSGTFGTTSIGKMVLEGVGLIRKYKR